MNQNSLWKTILIGITLFICALYALPNIFGEDPALQISPAFARDDKLTDDIRKEVEAKLKEANIPYDDVEFSPEQMLVRFPDTEIQLKAYSLLQREEKLKGFVIAQNLASATPSLLTAIGGKPMYLGLDLRGGVHFLMQVDMVAAVVQDEEQLVEDLRLTFREQKVRYKSIARIDPRLASGVRVTFTEADVRTAAKKLIERNYVDDVVLTEESSDGEFNLKLVFNENSLKTRKEKAIEQNITTLRNRINELGVAEPVIQQQGLDRILVQLPGVQDTARAKEILGATATLEFRLTEGSYSEWAEAQQTGKTPLTARLYKQRDGSPVLLKRSVIATGDQIDDASAGIDGQSGSPAAMVRLNGKGADRMFETTRENVGKLMAVVFIEYKVETTQIDGKEVKTRKKVEEVINVATIREAFGKNFQITGLTFNEATNLSLLLRAGALRAPIEIVEERTIGPSLGQENINQGMLSITLSFFAVMLFMWLRYREFGLIANAALLANFVMLVALMSLLQATLTLPGIAGIVLTLGMAVDANVLIYERMREEIINGNSPQASIMAGFDKAFSTIADSNVTTLIAGVVLFAFGTGPIKGFAVTLSLGILTSMFTAILITRWLINHYYGNRKVNLLPIYTHKTHS